MAGNVAWVTRALEELIEPESTITYGVVKPGESDPDGIRFIRGGDIADGRVLETQLRTISAELSVQYRRTLLRGGELIISLVGNPGQVAIVPPGLAGANIARQVGLVRLGSEVDPLFVRYFLSSSEGQATLGAKSLGSVQQVINLSDLKRIHVPVPPLPEQRAIAAVLGALDDKIEVNRKQARVLEGLARAVFNSWFVDFDPVRRKAAGEPTRLSDEISSLFPDRLVASPIGEVPAGWMVKTLPEVFDVNPTRSLKKGEVAPYLDMSNMPTQGHAPAEWIQREAGSGMRFVNGDTLVARITPCLENGKTAFVDFLAEGEVAWGSTEYIVLRPKPPLPPVLGYLLARNDRFRTHAIQAMTGSSGRQRVPAASLDHYQVVMPTCRAEAIGAAFATIVNPSFERMGVAMKQNRTLATLRDTLLPKLISGELRIADAEKIVGRAI